MLGLQQRVAAQDENAGSRLSLGKQQGLGLGFNTVKGGSDSAPRSFAGKVAATNAAAPRRALGNITNTGGAQKENEKPGSTAGQKPVARRALGDITNSTAAAPSSAQVPLPSKSTQPLSQSRTKQPQPSQSVDQPSKLLSGRSKAASQLDRPALDVHASIERPAGKLWAEQERDRKQREKEEINSRVQRLFAAMPPATALGPQYASSESDEEPIVIKVLPRPKAVPDANHSAVLDTAGTQQPSFLFDERPLAELLPVLGDEDFDLQLDDLL